MNGIKIQMNKENPKFVWSHETPQQSKQSWTQRLKLEATQYLILKYTTKPQQGKDHGIHMKT
jgi:hypothetical protein